MNEKGKYPSLLRYKINYGRNVLYIRGTEAKLNILQPHVNEKGKYPSLLRYKIN